MIEPRSQCFAAVTSALTPMKIAAYLIEKIGSTVSGYFHPSLWLSESHGLLVAKGLNGVEFGRLHRRQPAADHANQNQHDRGKYQGEKRQHKVNVHLAGIVFVSGSEKGQRADRGSQRPRKQHSDSTGGECHHQRFEQKL